jgi:hypothetical protein
MIDVWVVYIRRGKQGKGAKISILIPSSSVSNHKNGNLDLKIEKPNFSIYF